LVSSRLSALRRAATAASPRRVGRRGRSPPPPLRRGELSRVLDELDGKSGGGGGAREKASHKPPFRPITIMRHSGEEAEA